MANLSDTSKTKDYLSEIKMTLLKEPDKEDEMRKILKNQSVSEDHKMKVVFMEDLSCGPEFKIV